MSQFKSKIAKVRHNSYTIIKLNFADQNELHPPHFHVLPSITLGESQRDETAHGQAQVFVSRCAQSRHYELHTQFENQKPFQQGTWTSYLVPPCGCCQRLPLHVTEGVIGVVEVVVYELDFA